VHAAEWLDVPTFNIACDVFMTNFSDDEQLTYEQIILELAGNSRLTPDGRSKQASPDQLAMLQQAKEFVSHWPHTDHGELKNEPKRTNDESTVPLQETQIVNPTSY
jgi:hypothetical protein